jgi:hypothetical protein
MGTYGDSERKAAQANASVLHKTVLSNEAPVGACCVAVFSRAAAVWCVLVCRVQSLMVPVAVTLFFCRLRALT